MVQVLKERYHIIRELGKGGMGAVYEAKDTNLEDRRVAVKEMTQHNLRPQEILAASQAFKQEANMLAKLHHPNLPSIHDYFEEAGHWYLVMEFIKGETLQDYLVSKGGKLPLKDGLGIGIQLCTVLNYLHTRQPVIIFRDFKPGQTRDTAVAYSRGFAAPEQYGEGQTTIQSDIYSLGATLHYLLSGSHPAQSPFRFAPLGLKGQRGFDRLNALIMQMVEVDISTRPSSMVEVKQELQTILDDNNQLPPSHPKPDNQSPQNPIAYSPTPVQLATPPQRISSYASLDYAIGTEPIVETSKAQMAIWGIGVRQIVYMALGAALYGGLSWVTNIIQLPSAGNVSFRPAIVIPLFFGAVFGPWVGLVTGGLGNFLGDYISGYGIYWNWDVSNALIGFIAGLAVLTTFGRYNNTRNIIVAEVFAAIGVVVGNGFAAYTDIWISKMSFATATIGELVPAAGSDLINGLILLPILLIAYNAAMRRYGRG